MIIEERTDHALNLESIDKDLIMENVRQNAEKLGWDHFARSVRRNLLEKRQTLESRVRLDVLDSIAFMKEHLPIEKDASLSRKIHQLADGLGENVVITSNSSGFYIKHSDVTIDIGISEENVVSCKIGYFGQPLFEAPEALALLKNGEFSKLRDAIAGILSTIPKDISMHDKDACKDALRALEHVLIRDAADSSFAAINTSKYGFYSPRTELLPGRIYFAVDSTITKLAEIEGKSHPDSSYLDLLPFFEISFVKNEKKCKLPVFSQTGEWEEFNEANVCICVKFNQGFLFSQHTIRKLAHIVPKSPLVRSYVNFYSFIAGREDTKGNMKLLTQLPADSDIQQQFDIAAQNLKRIDDCIVLEMFIDDLTYLPKLVEILRSESMHASLWESIPAMCQSKPEAEQKEVKAINMQLVLRRNEFNLQFNTYNGSMSIHITEKSPCNYVVRTNSQLTGGSPCPELDALLSSKLNSTWSIPITLTFILPNLNCLLNSVLSPLNCADTPSTFDSHKHQQSFLTGKTMHSELIRQDKKKDKVVVLELGPAVEAEKLVYTREEDDDMRGSLLSSFGEVDPYYVETSTIGKTRAQPRPKREQSQLESMNMMSAELDLNKARPFAETTMNPMTPMNQMNPMKPQDSQRMSLLESARVHMKQSIGAAHAVGLASHQPHALPGGPMRQHSYTMGYDHPAPYDPHIPASIQFPDPSVVGKGKRKGRGKKQLGDDSVTPPSGRGRGSRKGRGAAAVAAGGGRKSTGVVPENPFGMDPMRPPLQRSFSDFPGQMNPQQMSQYQQMQQMQQYQNQQFQQSQQYRMQMQQHQMNQMQSPQATGMNTTRPQTLPPYTDEDSELVHIPDEECDPPPPPKPQVSAGTRSSVPPHQLGNPMVGYPGMPLQSPNHLPLTPSPLSAPPKPFSPDQQHFGMKMRENAYWKELDRLDTKPDVEKLKQQMAANAASSSSETTSSTSTNEKVDGGSNNQNVSTDASTPTQPTNKPPISAPTPKKKLGLEAAISKIRGQQEQALQKQQQEQLNQQQSMDSGGPSGLSTPLTAEPISYLQQPVLPPQQMNRARNLNGVFDDETGEDSSAPQDVKPSLSALQKALSTAPDSSGNEQSASSSKGSSALIANLKKEAADEEPEREKEKLILKIPKNLKTDDRKEERKERDRDRDRDSDRDRERDRGEKADRVQREKEKKEKERERRKQKERERAEQKKVEREKDTVSVKEKESSSKKRKLDKKDEKDRREPDKKKGKTDGSDHNKTPTTSTPTNFSLKNFRIPKKDTVDDEKKEESTAAGPSTSSESSSRKEPSAPSTSIRKESTSAASSSSAPLQRKESFTAQPASFSQSDHHREPPKKKPPPPVTGPPVGAYPGPQNMGPIPNNNRGGPRPPQMMRGPPEPYRDRAGSTRGYPPSSHHYGTPSGVNQKVASYAQGLPPGMGPPAVKPHGNNYQASQWVRPPMQHRDTHSYHGMSSLGPPQLQREPPPPPPQMIPLPREPPREPLPPPREPPRERDRTIEFGQPESPEEGTLMIDDE